VLLLLSDAESAGLFAEMLARSRRVTIGESDAAITGPYDLGIVDGPMLQRIWRRIAERKRAEAPTLLPFLLVTTPQDVSLFARFLWTAVDELIQAPVQTLEGPADASTLAGWDPAPVYGTSKGYRDQGASEIGGVFTPRSMYTALRPHAVQ
jgi:hypothetical protein